MSPSSPKTPAELFDDFIKLEWQDIFRDEVHVRLDNGARYVPNSGSQGVQLLRKNVNAFDEAIRIWSGSTDDPDSGTKGYDRIVEQAGVEYTWEWFLVVNRRGVGYRLVDRGPEAHADGGEGALVALRRVGTAA